MAKDETTAEEKPAAVEKKEVKKPAAKKDEKPAEKKGAKKDAKKDVKKAEAKKEEVEDIPMDAAAIKAYSSVIADAAEDSEPSTPVEYH
jgi:hypothetical protein